MSDGGGGSDPFAGGLAGFINEGLDAELSGREMLGQYREAGGQIADRTFYDALSTSVNARANAPEFVDLDPTVPVPYELHNDWWAGKAGTYAYDVDVGIRDFATGITWQVRYTATSDRPLTPQEAADQALGEFQQSTVEGGGDYQERIRGAQVVNAYNMMGRRR